jgi:heat shock protein HslJ
MDDEPRTPGDDGGTEGPAIDLWKTQKGRILIAIALLLVLIFLVVVVNVPAMRAAAGTTITMTGWQLRSYSDNTGVMVPALTDPVVTVRFTRDGDVTGSAGCNRFSARYMTEHSRINISEMGNTEMYCPGPGVMAQESAYLRDLAAAGEFRLAGSDLKLYTADGRPLLVFSPSG